MGRAVGSAESGMGQAWPTAAGQSAPGRCSGCAERNKTAVPAEPSSPNADPAAGPKPGLPGSTWEVPVKVASIEDVAKLPSGAWFETPDGQILRRGIGEAR